MPVQQTLTSFFTRSRPANGAVDDGRTAVESSATGMDDVLSARLPDTSTAGSSTIDLTVDSSPSSSNSRNGNLYSGPSSDGSRNIPFITSKIASDYPSTTADEAVAPGNRRKRKAGNTLEHTRKAVKKASSSSLKGRTLVTDARGNCGVVDDNQLPRSGPLAKHLSAPPVLDYLPGTAESRDAYPSSTTSANPSDDAQGKPGVFMNEKERGTREEPITVEDSPIEKKKPLPTPHPFFTRVRPTPSTIREQPGTRPTVRDTFPAPWPTSENQHVNHVSRSLHRQSSVFRMRTPNPKLSQEPNGSQDFNYRHSVTSSLPGCTNESDALTGAPLETNIPNPNPDQADLWVDKYRPQRASEVLGNEACAQYLKAWLRALELHLGAARDSSGSQMSSTLSGQGTAKPEIVRAVVKAARKGFASSDASDDDWIVQDDSDVLDSESEPGATEYLDQARRTSTGEDSRPPSSWGTLIPSSVHDIHEPCEPVFDFSQYLANVILLSGSPGSGKTACVYACAKELGWEVFEVYPGVGKRSGAAVTALVGAVSKNHLVKRGPVAETKGAASERVAEASVGAFFKKDRGASSDEGKLDARSSPINYNTAGAANSMSERSKTYARVHQSLILLEEVDILFREDSGFWPAILSMAKESRRPIVMTCNDATLVPRSDLPLQQHLAFVPPDVGAEVPYLRHIAKTEGYDVSSDLAMRIRDSKGDLRKSINALQWYCSGHRNRMRLESVPRRLSPSREQPVVEDGLSEAKELQKYDALMECGSFVDAFLARSAYRQMQAQEIDRCSPSADDEQGTSLLIKPAASECDIALWAYARDEVFAEEVEEAAGQYYGRLVPAIEDSEADVADMGALLQYLAPLIPISSYLLPSPAVVVDYAPYVRAMVLADDAASEADEGRSRAMLSRSGRPVRTAAARQGYMPYARWIILDEDGLRAARQRMT